MNHSILVVICDFLVLSVLSLSLGVAPMNSSFTGRGTRIDDYTANILLDELKAKSVQLSKARDALLKAQRKLGYAETRSKRVKKLDADLAQVQSRLNYLEVKLKKRKGEIGTLSKEKLLARLEKEGIRRLKVVTEMSEAKAALQFEQSKNKELLDNMTALRQDAMRRDDELTEKKTLLDERTRRLKSISDKLQKTESVLGSAKGNLTKLKSALSSTKGDLKSSKQSLDATKTRLKDIAVELTGTRGREKATLLDLSYVRGRLSATEKELAESRSRLTKNQKYAAVSELELKEAQKKITTLQNILKNAVGDLSKTQRELNVSRTKAKTAAEKLMKISTKEKVTQLALRSIKESLGDAVQGGLQNDALEKYSLSAVVLKMNVQEKRFLIDYKKSGTFYLPEVMVGGKRYLISSLDLLSGMRRLITKSSKINKLSYMVGKPKNGEKPLRIKTPLLSLKADSRVCLLEVPAIRKNSVELLTYGSLRKRGLQNLTLFKYTTFGEDSSSLDGRCSLGLKKGDNYLYIRNSVLKSAVQLKAEVGDFIMTKQGMFVGIAVEVENFNAGRQQRVKCFVFSDDFSIKDAAKIPLTKRSGAEYFSDFAEAVAKINSQLKHLDRIKRSRRSN
ncbi:MAG: hypothetical protein KAS17_02090 [Victivallaceae bacterium]|nr:hypothetical protein [Victivallaceae bacterium]